MKFNHLSGLMLVAGILFTGPASAQFSFGAGSKEAPKKAVIEPTDLSRTQERGWFYFDDPKKEPPKEEEKAPPAPKPPKPEESKKEPPKTERKDPCLEKGTWTATCGFVNPGTDFDFQAKQRDELLKAMVMSQNDPSQVEAFQYYMRWVIERTSEIANIWRYNMVQNPDLDPSVKAPISSFGLRLMTDIRKGNDKEVYDLIKSEGGMLVVFTRSDCIYCHQMAGTWNDLAKMTGIPLHAASLDEKCIEGLNAVECLTAPDTLPAAQSLSITVVPSTFLYVKPDTWLRIGNGVVDSSSMASRTVQFFTAYRSALLKGINNGQNGHASVDFSNTDPTGAAKGVDMPSEESISKFVNALSE